MLPCVDGLLFCKFLSRNRDEWVAFCFSLDVFLDSIGLSRVKEKKAV